MGNTLFFRAFCFSIFALSLAPISASAAHEPIAYASCPAGELEVTLNGSRTMGRNAMMSGLALFGAYPHLLANLRESISGTLRFAVAPRSPCGNEGCANEAGWSDLQAKFLTMGDVRLRCPSSEVDPEPDPSDEEKCHEEEEGPSEGMGDVCDPDDGEPIGDHEDDRGHALPHEEDGSVIDPQPLFRVAIDRTKASALDIGAAFEVLSQQWMWVVVPGVASDKVLPLTVGVEVKCEAEEGCYYSREDVRYLMESLRLIPGVSVETLGGAKRRAERIGALEFLSRIR